MPVNTPLAPHRSRALALLSTAALMLLAPAAVADPFVVWRVVERHVDEIDLVDGRIVAVRDDRASARDVATGARVAVPDLLNPRDLDAVRIRLEDGGWIVRDPSGSRSLCRMGGSAGSGTHWCVATDPYKVLVRGDQVIVIEDSYGADDRLHAHLRAFGLADGKLRWELPVGTVAPELQLRAPALGGGMVAHGYAGDGTPVLAVGEDGHVEWSLARPEGPSVVLADAVVRAEPGALVRIDLATGRVTSAPGPWGSHFVSITAGRDFVLCRWFDADERAYFGRWDVRDDGVHERWRWVSRERSPDDQFVVGDTWVYASNFGVLRARDVRTGRTLWTFGTTDDCTLAPAGGMRVLAICRDPEDWERYESVVVDASARPTLSKVRVRGRVVVTCGDELEPFVWLGDADVPLTPEGRFDVTVERAGTLTFRVPNAINAARRIAHDARHVNLGTVEADLCDDGD